MALSSTCVFASLAEVKPWLRLVATDAQDDTILEGLCNSVTEEIEAWTHRVFVTRAITQVFDSAGASQFVLRGYPVTTNPLTAFTIDGTAVDTAAYTLDTAGGIVTLTGGARTSQTGHDNVSVTYTAGYARASLPQRVVQLACEMVAFRYQDWAAGATAAQQVQYMPGGQTYTPRSSWPYHVKDALNALRVEVRGATVA